MTEIQDARRAIAPDNGASKALIIHDFGSAPQVVPAGYSFTREMQGSVDQIQTRFAGQDVVLVKSADVADPNLLRVGVFEWTPQFSRWRHGGWYVDNVRYPSGACGCVSNKYPDRKWRIVCDPRRSDSTYASRDAAARAERDLVQSMTAESASQSSASQ